MFYFVRIKCEWFFCLSEFENISHARVLLFTRSSSDRIRRMFNKGKIQATNPIRLPGDSCHWLHQRCCDPIFFLDGDESVCPKSIHLCHAYSIHLRLDTPTSQHQTENLVEIFDLAYHNVWKEICKQRVS